MTLALIVVLPLAILVWLTARLAREESELREQRVLDAARAALSSIDESVGAVLEEERAAIGLRVASVPLESASLREVARRLPSVRQLFLLDRSGSLVYPSLEDELSEDESAFLRRTRDLWLQGRRIGNRASASDEAFPDVAALEDRGWLPFYEGGGVGLIAFWKQPDGRVLGAELDRMHLLARIVAALPSSGVGSDRVRLVDAAGVVLHQWGAFEPPPGARPSLRVPLGAPLSALALEYLAPPGPAAGAALAPAAAPWLALLAALVVVLAAFFYRESSREMREAAERVTFVNQVSHELKTPLTNIRMYAELLEAGLDDDPEARRRVEVIVAESQRLSRLILNILTFGKKQRHELRLKPGPGIVDEAIAAVLGHFRPALAAAGVETRFQPGASRRCLLDPDAFGQILGNLLNNVEKYAASGREVAITSTQADDSVTVTVADLGPGIPEAERPRVFEPFYRISNALKDGVTGTGIGLAIARDLARLHGGDLAVVPSERGACFRLTLRAPIAGEARP
ncbi:MAG: HAMP domain-containing sensor histidine kinase [Acidobacteriota bacterium]